MKHWKLVILLSFALLSASPTLAQCPRRYARTDRAVVQQVMIQVNSYLSRMGELAFLGSIGAPVVNLNLNTHREAIRLEYDAILSDIDNQVANPPLSVRPRTARWLQQIASAQATGVAGTTITGPTDAQAEANSLTAHAATENATANLWSCF